MSEIFIDGIDGALTIPHDEEFEFAVEVINIGDSFGGSSVYFGDDSASVSLGPFETATVTLRPSGPPPGERQNTAVGTDDEEFFENLRREEEPEPEPGESELGINFVSTFVHEDDPNLVGADVDLENRVTSGGGATLSDTAVVTVNDETVHTETVELGPGATTQLVLDLEVETGEVKVCAEYGGEKTCSTETAGVFISEMSISNVTAEAVGPHEVVVQVRVNNEIVAGAGSDETRIVTVEANGEQVASDTVTVIAADAETVAFELDGLDEGSYEICGKLTR